MITQLKAEKVNFFTHFIAMLLWIPLTGILVFLSSCRIDFIIMSCVYGIATITLFFASSNYHRHKKEENEISIYRKFDHIAIFIMIAGTYTPALWIWFDDPARIVLLVFQWCVALFGLFWNLFSPKRVRWLEVVLYLAMGWVCVWALKPLYDRMPLIIFLDLIIGGVLYSAGAVIYAVKKPDPFPGKFGFHEIFHVLIVAAAGFHFSMVLRSILVFIENPNFLMR